MSKEKEESTESFLDLYSAHKSGTGAAKFALILRRRRIRVVRFEDGVTVHVSHPLHTREARSRC